MVGRGARACAGPSPIITCHVSGVNPRSITCHVSGDTPGVITCHVSGDNPTAITCHVSGDNAAMEAAVFWIGGEGVGLWFSGGSSSSAAGRISTGPMGFADAPSGIVMLRSAGPEPHIWLKRCFL